MNSRMYILKQTEDELHSLLNIYISVIYKDKLFFSFSIFFTVTTI